MTLGNSGSLCFILRNFALLYDLFNCFCMCHECIIVVGFNISLQFLPASCHVSFWPLLYEMTRGVCCWVCARSSVLYPRHCNIMWFPASFLFSSLCCLQNFLCVLKMQIGAWLSHLSFPLSHWELAFHRALEIPLVIPLTEVMLLCTLLISFL